MAHLITFKHALVKEKKEWWGNGTKSENGLKKKRVWASKFDSRTRYDYISLFDFCFLLRKWRKEEEKKNITDLAIYLFPYCAASPTINQTLTVFNEGTNARVSLWAPLTCLCKRDAEQTVLIWFLISYLQPTFSLNSLASSAFFVFF